MGARSKAPLPCPAELKDSHPWKERKMLPVGSQTQLCLGYVSKDRWSLQSMWPLPHTISYLLKIWRWRRKSYGNQEFDSVPSVNYIILASQLPFFYPGGRRPSFCHTSPGGFAAGTKHCWTRCVTKNLIITGGSLESCQANMGEKSWFAVPTKQTKHAEQKNPTKLRPLHYLQAIWSLQVFRSTPKRRVQRMQDDSFPQQRKTHATCGSTPLEVETSPFSPYAIFEYFQDLYHNVYILYTYYVFNVLHDVIFSPHTSLSINISTGKHL